MRQKQAATLPRPNIIKNMVILSNFFFTGCLSPSFIKSYVLFTLNMNNQIGQNIFLLKYFYGIKIVRNKKF